MKQEKVNRLENEINKNYDNIAGVVVLKDNAKVYENYFNDCDDASRIHVFSVSKSIISILIGIAIDKGYIKNVNEKVANFFPEYMTENKEDTFHKITLKDLLIMGVPYKYTSDPDTYMQYFMSNDWVKFSLDQLGEKDKIGNFNYTPLIGPDILSGILVKATGKSVFDFATENLFEPLEITVDENIQFMSAEEQMAFNTTKDRSGWVTDSKGVNTGGWGLTLSATDMAKVGQLYLNDGVIDGNRIVSSEWISESTQEHNRWREMNLPYGYLWWIIDEDEHACAAMGDGGNVIYFNAEKGIVVSIASIFEQDAKDRLGLIKEYIEPIFEDFK